MLQYGNCIFLPRNNQTQAVQLSLFSQHDKKKNISCIRLHNRVTIKVVWQYHITIFYRFNELGKVFTPACSQPSRSNSKKDYRCHLSTDLILSVGNTKIRFYFFGTAVGYRLNVLTLPGVIEIKNRIYDLINLYTTE